MNSRTAHSAQRRAWTRASILAAALLCIGAPAAGQAPKETRVSFQSGSSQRNGYEHAALDIVYRATSCGGGVHIAYGVEPGSIDVTGAYWLDGHRYPIRNGWPGPRYQSFSVQMKALHGARVIREWDKRDPMVTSTLSCSSAPQFFYVDGGWEALLGDRARDQAARENALASISIDAPFEADRPLRNPEIESLIRREIQAAEAEAEAERRAEEQRRAEAERKAEEERRAAQERERTAAAERAAAGAGAASTSAAASSAGTQQAGTVAAPPGVDASFVRTTAGEYYRRTADGSYARVSEAEYNAAMAREREARAEAQRQAEAEQQRQEAQAQRAEQARQAEVARLREEERQAAVQELGETLERGFLAGVAITGYTALSAAPLEGVSQEYGLRFGQVGDGGAFMFGFGTNDLSMFSGGESMTNQLVFNVGAEIGFAPDWGGLSRSFMPYLGAYYKSVEFYEDVEYDQVEETWEVWGFNLGFMGVLSDFLVYQAGMMGDLDIPEINYMRGGDMGFFLSLGFQLSQ